MFLSSVTARFIWEFAGQDISSRSGISYFLIGGLILLMYLLGKLQKQENLQQMQAMMSQMMPGMGQPFYDRKMEIATIGIGIVNFVVCIFYPEILSNAFINWFSETIHGIYEAPIIGFIFKIIGFFFLLSIILKGFTSIARSLGLMPPAPEGNVNANFNMFSNFQNMQGQDQNDDDNGGYDKYEEVEDDEADENTESENKKDLE